MPTIQRSTLHRGPGNLTYDSLTLFSQEDITAAIEIETWRPKISTHGEGAPRIADARGQITFTPAGRITPEIIAALFPAGFRNPTIGARVFPAADKPLSIHGVDGAKLDFVSAALTKMPGLTLSPKGTAFGEAGFTALIGDNKERSAAGSFYTAASAAWSGAFSDAAIIAVPYSGVWGATALHTEEGWKIDLEAQIEPIVVDGIGTVDYELTGVTARATCRPVDMPAASFAVEKMQVTEPNRANPDGSIIYHSGMNPKIQRNFEVFSPCDFIAAITQHIPDKSFQLVRYYGWYSNKMRGQRDKHATEDAAAAGRAVQIIDVSEHKPRRIPSKKWRELIKKVWEADPLLCPKCQKEMRIVSLINERDVIERILRHLGLWEQGVRVLPARAPPEVAEWVIEPCYDDPFPDYDTEPVMMYANG